VTTMKQGSKQRNGLAPPESLYSADTCGSHSTLTHFDTPGSKRPLTAKAKRISRKAAMDWDALTETDGNEDPGSELDTEFSELINRKTPFAK
jgi:hypothetical protein